eukprot:29379_1
MNQKLLVVAWTMYTKSRTYQNGDKRIMLHVLKAKSSKHTKTSYPFNKRNAKAFEIMMKYGGKKSKDKSNDKFNNCKIQVKPLLKKFKSGKKNLTDDNVGNNGENPKYKYINVMIKLVNMRNKKNKININGQKPIYKYININIKLINMKNMNDNNDEKPIYRYVNVVLNLINMINEIKIELKEMFNKIRCKYCSCQMNDKWKYNLQYNNRCNIQLIIVVVYMVVRNYFNNTNKVSSKIMLLLMNLTKNQKAKR